MSDRMTIEEFAAQLRVNATKSELAVLPALTERGFVFQQVIGPYVVDFFHHETGLIVEIDGWSHNGRESEDDKRAERLTRNSPRTLLRFTDQQALHDQELMLKAVDLHVEFERACEAIEIDYVLFTDHDVRSYARAKIKLSYGQWERGMAILGMNPQHVVLSAMNASGVRAKRSPITAGTVPSYIGKGSRKPKTNGSAPPTT